MLKISRDELKLALDRLCKVASTSPEDAGASELKFTASDKGVVVQAANFARTITSRYVFSAASCEVDEPTEFCVPAAAMRDTVNLLKGDNIELTLRQRVVTVSDDADDSADAEQSLIGMLPSGWNGAPSFTDETASFVVDRNGIIGVAKFTAFSCTNDPSMAPLTAIRITVTAGGDLKTISSDQGRTSFFDMLGTCRNVKLKADDSISFMLTSTAAKMLPQMFGQEHSEIAVRTNGKRIIFQAGGLSLDVSAEVGLENYPRLDTVLVDGSGFSWTVDLAELKRVISLVNIVAGKHLARIEFTKAGKLIISGTGKIEKGAKSRQTITPTQTEGDLLDENTIDVSCFDLMEAIGVPTATQVKIGLAETTNQTINPVLIIEQDADVAWKHMMRRSVSVD